MPLYPLAAFWAVRESDDKSLKKSHKHTITDTQVTWCFTPSQTLWLYQGDATTDKHLGTLHKCMHAHTHILQSSYGRSKFALDPTFGIHSHKTLDTAQPRHLLKPNWKPSSSHSTYILTNINTQFLLQSVYVCVCVCARAYVFVVFFNKKIYNTLCRLFWWDCALYVYRISYLG